MRVRLGESLRYVLDQAGDALPAPTALAAFFQRLAAGPVVPQAFGAYFELVLAIDDDALPQAAGFLEEIAAAPARGSALVIRSLGDPAHCPFSRRYQRLVDTDPRLPLALRAPDPQRAAQARSRIASAVELIERAHPDLHAELRALLGEVVLAAPAANVTSGSDFDGVSSFMLWGGVVLNARSHETTLEMVEVLAHESGHNLLFGLAADGPLLTNDDDACYASPLRDDARPLDGIYHATYVTARMHHTLCHLRDVGALDAEPRASVEARLETHRKNFEQGLSVLDRHACLTEVGARVMRGARAHLAPA